MINRFHQKNTGHYSENAPWISVLIPAFNRALTLRQCVDSVIANKYNNIEIIIADNGSTDNTLTIAEELAHSDRRIRIIRHQRNLGPLANWRSCLDEASHDLIHWLWSDDWIEPEFYHQLTTGMHARQAQMGLSAHRIVCPEVGWWNIGGSLPDTTRQGDDLLVGILYGSVPIASPACCLLPKKSVQNHFHSNIPRIDKIDCSLRAIGPDQLMIMGSAYDSDFVYTDPEPLVNFRAHADSISIKDSKILDPHYAFARCWWSRRHHIPRKYNFRDFRCLFRNKCFNAALVAMI
jgi:glycosyltransferase involved in cell wall biosynthesis